MIFWRQLLASTCDLIFCLTFNILSETRWYSVVCSELDLTSVMGHFAEVLLVLSCGLFFARVFRSVFRAYWGIWGGAFFRQQAVAKLAIFCMVHCPNLRFCLLILCTSFRISSLRDQKTGHLHYSPPTLSENKVIFSIYVAKVV